MCASAQGDGTEEAEADTRFHLHERGPAVEAAQHHPTAHLRGDVPRAAAGHLRSPHGFPGRGERGEIGGALGAMPGDGRTTEVEAIRDTSLSLMPEGLLDPLSPAEVRDLIAYLMGPQQVPLPADARGRAEAGSPAPPARGTR